MYMSLSAFSLKTQFPVETNGKTSTFLQRTLSECCFAGEMNLRSLDCFRKEKKRIPTENLTSEFRFFCFSLISQIICVCELHNSEHLRKATITLPTLGLSF